MPKWFDLKNRYRSFSFKPPHYLQAITYMWFKTFAKMANSIWISHLFVHILERALTPWICDEVVRWLIANEIGNYCRPDHGHQGLPWQGPEIQKVQIFLPGSLWSHVHILPRRHGSCFCPGMDTNFHLLLIAPIAQTWTSKVPAHWTLNIWRFISTVSRFQSISRLLQLLRPCHCQVVLLLLLLKQMNSIDSRPLSFWILFMFISIQVQGFEVYPNHSNCLDIDCHYRLLLTWASIVSRPLNFKVSRFMLFSPIALIAQTRTSIVS